MIINAIANIIVYQPLYSWLQTVMFFHNTYLYYIQKQDRIELNTESQSCNITNLLLYLLHPRLDLVNMVVRPFLFTKLSLFTKWSIDKE